MPLLPYTCTVNRFFKGFSRPALTVKGECLLALESDTHLHDHDIPRQFLFVLGIFAYRRLFGLLFVSIVDGKQISKIGKGICVLVGLSVDDTTADLDFMVRKLLSVRVFDSSDDGFVEESTSSTSAAAAVAGDTQDAASASNRPRKMWVKSVVDVGGEILCGKGNKDENL